MRRQGIAVAVALAVAAVPGQAFGQDFWDEGLELIGSAMVDPEGWIKLLVSSQGEGDCVIDEALIVAEVERGMRRDGVRVELAPNLFAEVLRRHSEEGMPELSVFAVQLPVRTMGNRLVGCVANVEVELDLVGSESAYRAFSAGRLLVRSSPEAMGRSVRQYVEEVVSVLANRLRREIDAVSEGRR